MNVEIGAQAALFPEKEYINGIAVAVQLQAEYNWLAAGAYKSFKPLRDTVPLKMRVNKNDPAPCV